MYIRNQAHLEEVIKGGGVPDSVTYLLVYNCTSLTELNVPDSVTSLRVDNCTSLTELNVPDSVTYLRVYNCTSLTELNVPDSVTSLLVYDCTSLTELNVPDSVTYLRVYNCTSLTELNVPDSVTSLRVDNCTSLTELNVPDSVTYLLVYNCTSLTELNVPDSVTSLLVDNCTSLTELNVPDSVTSLLVDNCTSLTELNVPDSVTSLPKLKLENIDGVLTAHTGKWKKSGGIERIKGFAVNGTPPFTPTHIVRGGGYTAHGETLNEAVQDHAFKLLGDIDAPSVARICVKDGFVTMPQWRAMTGACTFGTKHHLRAKGLTEVPEKLPIDRALSLSAGTSYGDKMAALLAEAA